MRGLVIGVEPHAPLGGRDRLVGAPDADQRLAQGQQRGRVGAGRQGLTQHRERAVPVAALLLDQPEAGQGRRPELRGPGDAGGIVRGGRELGERPGVERFGARIVEHVIGEPPGGEQLGQGVGVVASGDRGPGERVDRRRVVAGVEPVVAEPALGGGRRRRGVESVHDPGERVEVLPQEGHASPRHRHLARLAARRGRLLRRVVDAAGREEQPQPGRRHGRACGRAQARLAGAELGRHRREHPGVGERGLGRSRHGGARHRQRGEGGHEQAGCEPSRRQGRRRTAGVGQGHARAPERGTIGCGRSRRPG